LATFYSRILSLLGHLKLQLQLAVVVASRACVRLLARLVINYKRSRDPPSAPLPFFDRQTPEEKQIQRSNDPAYLRAQILILWTSFLTSLRALLSPAWF